MFFPFIPPGIASGRVQELSRRLNDEVERYRREQPDLKDWEIREACRQAARSSDQQRRMLFALVGGVVALLGLTLMSYQRSRPIAPEGVPGGDPSSLWVAATIAGLLLALAVVVILKRR